MRRAVQKRRDEGEREPDDEKRADTEQSANRDTRLIVAGEIKFRVRPLAIEGPEPV
jgi:hypothetical protein